MPFSGGRSEICGSGMLPGTYGPMRAVERSALAASGVVGFGMVESAEPAAMELVEEERESWRAIQPAMVDCETKGCC